MRSEYERLIHHISSRAADKLFRNGGGQNASTLGLLDAKAKYLGGWCKRAVKIQIAEAIREVMEGGEKR